MKKEGDADSSQIALTKQDHRMNKQDSAGNTPAVPNKGMSKEARRRRSLLRKGSASAGENLVSFLKASSKE